MLRSYLLPLLALFCAVAPAQDEAKILSSFKKAFAIQKANKEGPSIADKKAALQQTVGLDSSKVAEVLVEGWQNLDEELTALDAHRAELNDEIAKLIKGQESSPNRTLPEAQHIRYNELKPLVARLRDQADDMRELHQALGDRIGELRRRDSALWLLKKVCGEKKSALPLRLAAARAVGGAATEVLEELATAIERARQPAEQIVLLDAMTLAGKAARPHATPIIKLLESKEPAVAERAALALAKIAVPEAIAPMIKLMEQSSGPMRPRIVAALEVLTGQDFGDNYGAWQGWWTNEGKNLDSGQLGKGVPSNRKVTNENYYFGIPQNESDAILYVIDCSGSMEKPVRLKTGTTAGGEPEEVTRLQASQIELNRALGKLRPAQKFAILWYNDLPHWWEPKMQPATKAAVERAQQFVNTLKPASSTNIHDSFELGFSLVGRGAHDKYYGIELDTIFLLTDGSPTRPDGSLDSTEKILVGVRAWNPLKRVTIHCIAIGKDLNEPFLRQLASENGGEFKAF